VKLRYANIRKMNYSRWIVVFCLAVLGFGPAARAGPTETAQRCGIDETQKPARVFADPQGKKEWKEYPNLDAAPILTLDMGATADLMWIGSGGKIFFEIQDLEEDFSFFTDYCFDSRGQLIQLRYEFRTAWGWGYRIEGPVATGTLKPKISEFFRTDTDVRIEKPRVADDPDFARFFKPKLYPRQSLLPFSKLLSR
jgi:hypothetical protein